MKWRRALFGGAAIVASLALWQVYVTVSHLPNYVVPGIPSLARELVYLAHGELLHDTLVTGQELVAGMLYGAFIGIVIGLLMAKSRLVERLLTPIVLIVQTAPKISLAPLIILWFGLGLGSKEVLVAIATFYPVMINLSTAVASIDPNLRTLFRLLHTSWWQALWHLEFPGALPALLAGLRIATTQAVTAVVIGELVGSNAGLGYLLSEGQNNADVPMVMVAIAVLSFLGYVSYSVIRIGEIKTAKWIDHSSNVL